MNTKQKKPRKLSFKQQKFKEAYISTNGNGTEAARIAGYKGNDNALAQRAFELVRNSNVMSAIDKGMARIEARTDVTLLEVISNARYLIDLGKEKKNGADIAAGNKQLGEMIAAFKQVQQSQVINPVLAENCAEIEAAAREVKIKLASTG